MIPVKLKLQGFLSYREPVTLDFTGFHLACISGHNGAGKSALLDAITWALFGQARRRDESLINNHPSVEAAEVTLDFDYEGNRYRVQRTNPRGKTSSVEFFILSRVPGEEGRWKPLTERTIRETDQKIEETLRMDYDTFTNASFFLQGKADQFATARPSERKAILGKILGLEIWETYREKAGEQRRLKEKKVRELDGRLREIQSELDEGPQREAHLRELEAKLENLTKQREERAAFLDQVRRFHAALEEQHKMLTALGKHLQTTTQTRDRVQSTLAARRQEKTEYKGILTEAEAIEQAYQDWQAARKALEAMEEVAAQFHKHESLRHEPLRLIGVEEAQLKQEKQSLAEQKAGIEAALSQKETLKAELRDLNEKIEGLEEKLAYREQLEVEIKQLQVDQADAKAENPRLKTEMDTLRARLDQLEAADEPKCPVCGQPLSEADRAALIATYYSEGNDRRDRFLANKDLLANFEGSLRGLGAQMADLKGIEVSLRGTHQAVDRVENKLAALKEQQSQWEEHGAPRYQEIQEILATEHFALVARARLSEIEDELEGLGYDVEAHKHLRMVEQTGAEAGENLRALEQARAALGPIEREIAGLEEQLAELETTYADQQAAHDEEAARIAALEADMPDLSQAESELHNIKELENRLRMDVGAARQKVAVLETLENRKAGLNEARETITQSIADLGQLERAFGKDGIPALLIEQALPEIEETTNSLLSRLSNGRMSFNFMTQREYKDTSREDLKETLDIVIRDSVGERDYEMFSGGEAFRVNFSIRLALSKVLARRAGARLQTLVVDEGFGSQDAQGRQRLVEAINLVQDDFEKILVITHLEELKDVFPTRIEVEKTAQGSQVQVV
jgi:exonuclease SbcC